MRTFTVDLGADDFELDMPLVRDWPAWAVPAVAVGEWVELQLAIGAAATAPVCRSDPEAWWQQNSQTSAVEACSWCLVLVECRSYAIAARESHGVWGGLTAAERRAR